MKPAVIDIVLLFFFFLVFPSPTHAIDIANSSFENDIEGWSKTTSTIQFLATSVESQEASHSAELTYASTTSQGIKQSISSISADKTYKISAQIKTTTAKKAFIRIAWYQTGSTAQIRTDDSPIIGPDSDWILNEFIVTPPINATSAEIRLFVSEGTAYFDTIAMIEYLPPTQIPTPTATTTPQPSGVPSATPTASPTPISTSYDQIYISEAFVYPDSGLPEWIELYNNNSFSVILSGWYIDDTADSGSLPKSINTTIPPKGYAVVEMTTSLFNNAGDAVRLLDPNKKLKDSFEYTISQKNYSIGRNDISNNNVCIQTPTKSVANLACTDIYTQDDEEEVTPTPYLSPTSVPTVIPTSKKTMISPKIKGISNKQQVTPRDHSKPANNNKLVKDIKAKQQKKQKTASFLATTYSLLSFLSIGVKMIITRQ